MLFAAPTRCSAGQGFGGAQGGRQARKDGKGGKQKPKQGGVQSGDSKAVQRAVRLVEQQEARQQPRGGSGVRPVDPREAARGKVEFVKAGAGLVKDWGTGQPADLGSLQVEEATQVFEAGSDVASGGADGGMPFHEALARRLELLQSSGALGVAQLPGGKPLPPFEQWAFAQQHYAAYLADLHAVHAALEDSLAAAAGAEAEALAAGPPPAAVARHQRLHAALQLFGPEQGLARAAVLLQDLQRLDRQPQEQQGQQQQQQQSSELPAPTQHAAAYAAYLGSLARQRRAAEGPEEEERAVLRLLANAYLLYLMHLTSGGRIAAAAAARLDLAARDALAFYKDYPQLPPDGGKPLERLVGAANRLGLLLTGEQQETLMEELGKATTKTSMLLAPLARQA